MSSPGLQIEDVTADTANVFLFWEGALDPQTRFLLRAAIWSIGKFNPGHRIYLFSNSVSQDALGDVKHCCDVVRWNLSSLCAGTPLAEQRDAQAIYGHPGLHPRVVSDLFRLLALYRWGGSYVDTDNICVRGFPADASLICRTYDPHSISSIHKLPISRCMEGRLRENGLYPEIPFMLRNDCLFNFTPGHPFLERLLTGPIVVDGKPLMHGNSLNWQLRILKMVRDTGPADCGIGISLNLIYLFEGFLAGDWGVRYQKGEMIDIYRQYLDTETTNFRELKTDEATALAIFYSALVKFPNASFLWMNDKSANDELFLKTPRDQMRPSSHIFHHLIASDLALK